MQIGMNILESRWSKLSLFNLNFSQSVSKRERDFDAISKIMTQGLQGGMTMVRCDDDAGGGMW